MSVVVYQNANIGCNLNTVVSDAEITKWLQHLGCYNFTQGQEMLQFLTHVKNISYNCEGSEWHLFTTNEDTQQI